MLNNYYWISAPCFAIILVIILLKEIRWLKSPSALARSLYLMLFFAMVHSLPVSAIDLCISDILVDRQMFFPMALTSFVTSSVLLIFWLNFVLRYVKAKILSSYVSLTVATLIALTGLVLVSYNLFTEFHSPRPVLTHAVAVWRLVSVTYKNIVYACVLVVSLRRILHKFRKREKVKTRYVASFIAALVPLAIDSMFWGKIPVCSLTLSTSCLILYIYAVSNEREELQRSKVMFLENMSHEIRTTLNSVYGFAQLLALPEGTWSAEERESYATHIRNSYNMLDMLLNDLMVSTRYDTHSYTVQKVATNVRTVVADAIDAVRVCMPSSVEISVASELPDGYTIMSDGRRIRQIVQNLLTNACQYIVEGTIFVDLQLKGRTMRIFVTADMPASQVKNKNGRELNHEEASITKHKTGLGLRLLICRKMAMLLGGTVKRDLGYDKGIKYEFKLKGELARDSARTEVLSSPGSLVQAPAHSS